MKDLVLDPQVFGDAQFLQQDENLGRLNATTADGDIDGDGEFEVIHSYGARSFSVWTATGERVWDSGQEFEEIIASLIPDDFNSNNDENDSFDARSDDKGPEPEALELGRVLGHTFAFIGCERIGGVHVEARVLPREQRVLGFRAQALGLAQAAQHHPPEQLRQRLQVPPRDPPELSPTIRSLVERALGDQRVHVRMEVRSIAAEGLDRGDRPDPRLRRAACISTDSRPRAANGAASSR